MSQQITLLDVCKLPDVQIHSKTALFKYLINRENSEMLKLRENIVKLSYTNKIIGVKGDEVGIVSKRLPLKYKQQKPIEKSPPKQNIQFVTTQNGYISHKNFYVAPLPTVKRINTNEWQQKVSHNFQSMKTVNAQIQNQYQQFFSYRPINALKPRSQSMAKLKAFEKKSKSKTKQIKMQIKPRISDKKKTQSYSNLLKQFNVYKSQNVSVRPILHQQNPLFKRYGSLLRSTHYE